MKENKFKFIPLLESGLKNRTPPTPSEEKDFKNYYLILKCDEDNNRFITNHSGIFIMYNKKSKQIGNKYFNIKSKITLDSSSDAIKKEINRYFGYQHKIMSMAIHPYLKPI